MIRNAVIHVLNEQPLLADLLAMPSGADVGLLCTNLRMLDGKRPVFVDRIESVFFFPYLHIRFVEILPGTAGVTEPDSNGTVQAFLPEPVEEEPDLEIDEDFLRRIREV